MPALSINNIEKSFKTNQPVLKDVSMTVEEGEMVGLIGASGSGKSTLIRLIAGFETIDATGGSIRLFGKECQLNGRKSRDMTDLRTEIGIIFQQFNLVGRLSLLTNVVVGRLGRISRWRGTIGLFPRSDKIIALKALERVGIVDRAYQRASTLSGGQQQRAAIARALAQEAKLILADEPIASLDPASAENVMSILREINKQDGVTVIVSLHQIDHAFKHCDRIIALKDGKVVQDGPVNDMTEEDLQSLYGIDAFHDEAPGKVTNLSDYGQPSSNGPNEQGLGHRHRPDMTAATAMDA